MIYRLRFAERARDHLAAIHRWIAAAAGPQAADALVLALIDRCETLRESPFIGSPRDDIRPNLRTLSHRRRYTIGYRVDGDIVTVLGVIGRGQPIGSLVDR